MVKLCSPFQACKEWYSLRPEPRIDVFQSSNYSTNVTDTPYVNSTESCCEKDQWGALSYLTSIFWMEYISICVIGNIVVLAGLIGNILNIIVLSRASIGRETTTMLLLVLAVTDTFVLVTHFGQFTPCFTCYLDASYTTFKTTLLMSSTFHSIATGFLSVDITAIIALERAIAVFFPFKVSIIITKRTVTFMLLSLAPFILAILIPFYVTGYVLFYYDPLSNNTVVTESSFSLNLNIKMYLTALKWIENLHLIVGMFTVLVCGSATAIKLIYQSKSRKLMTANASSVTSAKDWKVVKMLLVVCLFSFIGNIPNISTNIITAYYRKHLHKKGLYCFVRGVTLVFIVINSSVNFFIYLSMSAKFQKAYRDMFTRPKCTNCLTTKKNP